MYLNEHYRERMRTILIILLSTIITGQVFARCTGEGLWTFPQKGTIKQNSLIVLTGYARSQKIVTSLNQKHPIYLESEGHKVKLNVKSTFKGYFQLTQAILEPSEKLIAGRTYQLRIEKLDEFEKPLVSRWNSELGKDEPITWKVEGGTDTEIPELVNEPELLDKRTILLGCGSATYADFKIQTKDESQVLVKTELFDLETDESTTYFLSFDETDTLSVGHGMCSGAFDFKQNGKYKVRFALMDICGNENDKWTAWIEFDSPLNAD